MRVKKPFRSALLTLVALGVIAALLWFGDFHKIVALTDRFKRIYIVWFFILILAHEVVRCVLWLILVQRLAIRATVRTQIFAFAAGEAAKFLPTGAYLQNYLLQRLTGSDFGESSAATTVIIVGEIAAALLGVAVIGVGAWSLGLRLAIIVLGVVAVVLLRNYLTAPPAAQAPRWMRQRKLLASLFEELRRFRAGAELLTHPRTIAITLALSMLYVLISGASLYLVVLGLDIGSVSFFQAVAVNCFGLAFYVVLGSLEAADVGVLIGIGLSKSAAVTVILINRGLNIGFTIAIAAIVLVALRSEWHREPWSRRIAAPGTTTAMGPSET